jgi:hypothetical protein
MAASWEETMKRLAVFAALILLSVPCRAYADKEIYLLGGVVLANLGGDAETIGNVLAAELQSEVGGSWRSSKKMKTGYDFGLGIGYSKADNPWGAAAEVHYVERGTKWDLSEDSSGTVVNTKLNLKYVEIPLLLRVTSQSTAKVRPFFVLGPVLGFKSSSKIAVSVQGNSSSADFPGMKGSYWAGLFGGGAQFRTSETSAFLLQARYQLGFSNLLDNPAFSTKPQDLSFLAGYSKSF